MAKRIFISGAGGAIGGRLLRVFASRKVVPVALARRPDAKLRRLVEGAGGQLVVGDLWRTDDYAATLEGCHAVIHLAARTGQASANAYHRDNVESTERLCRVCRDVGVARFVHVSTIAVRFTDAAGYAYADTKREAETVVSESDLRWSIVRPTMVFGSGMPVLHGLARLAALPVVPLFNGGRAHVQPIDCDDLVDCLYDLATSDLCVGESLEMGGPEVVTIRDLLARMRAITGRSHGWMVPFPVPLARAFLAPLETLAPRLVPLTRGQLCTFANDGTAKPNKLWSSRVGGFRDLQTMLASL